MTAKEIFESIDLSQLPKEAADKFRKVEKATKGFTIESEKVNTFMRGAYKKIKESKPTALKNLKVEEKIVKKEVKKGKTTQIVENLEYKVKGTKKVSKKTPTPSKPKRKGETAMERGKKIRKKGESWSSAFARGQKELKAEAAKAKSDADKAISTTSKALKTLEDMIQNDPKLKGYPRTYGKQSKRIDANKDAKIKAKPAGKRVSKKGHKNQYGESKGGRVYWENRDNRSDRYAPNFPNKVYLEMGGETDDLGFPTGHTFLVVEVSPSGDKKLIKSTKDYMTALMSSAVARGMKSNKDARVVIVDKEDKKVIHEAFEAGGEITITPTQLINNPDALVGTTTMTELFECGGVTAYQEGGEVFVTPNPLLNAGSGDYVAGSNTMSNMFAKGGQVSLGMKKDLEFFEDIRVKTLNMEGKHGMLLKYGFVEPEDAEKYEKESGYKFKEDKSIAGVIDVKENKTKMQGVEDGDKYYFFFNTSQPDRVVIIDAFDGDKLSATRADNKRLYNTLKLFLLGLRLETSRRKMAKGGYVAVGEKDGFWSIISTPTTKEKAKELLDMTTLPKGEKGKVVSVAEAMSHKNVIGKEYLESGGTIVAADPSAAMEDLNQTYGYESVYAKGGRVANTWAIRRKRYDDKIADLSDDLENTKDTIDETQQFLRDIYGKEITYQDRLDYKYAKGGRLGFEGLAKKVAKRYEGKPVKAKYQKEYGKTYSKQEAMEVGRKVAAKVYGQQQANMKKMAKGGALQSESILVDMQNAIKSIRDEWKSKKTDTENRLDKYYASLSEAERKYQNVIKFGEEHIKKAKKSGDKILEKKLKLEISNIQEDLKQVKNDKSLIENSNKFAKGGSLDGHGLKSGDVIISQEGYLTKILDKEGNPLFVNLQDGYRGREKPLPFAKGGAVGAMKIPDIAKKFGKTTADVFAQLQVGEKHEMEHTNDPKKARKIALDHLSKDLDYYTKLNKLGL